MTLLTQITNLYNQYNVKIKPHFAYITKDCRSIDEQGPSGNLSRKQAINLGEFFEPSLLEICATKEDRLRAYQGLEKTYDSVVRPEEYYDDSEFDMAMPLLLSDQGDLIWGIECFWQRREPQEMIESIFTQNRVIEKLARALPIGKKESYTCSEL